jgi:hypothetical protein
MGGALDSLVSERICLGFRQNRQNDISSYGYGHDGYNNDSFDTISFWQRNTFSILSEEELQK